MKKSFRLLSRFLAVALLLSMVNCAQDDYGVHKAQSKDPDAVSFETFKKATNIKALPHRFQLTKNTNGMAERPTELAEFIVDTLLIKQAISEDHKTTFSFRIYPAAEEPAERERYNLVFRQEKGVWQQAIFYLKIK